MADINTGTVSKFEHAVVLRVDAATDQAYSRNRYLSWTNVVRTVLRAGWSEADAVVILNSKLPRWAADADGATHGMVRTRALTRWLATQDGQNSLKSLFADEKRDPSVPVVVKTKLDLVMDELRPHVSPSELEATARAVMDLFARNPGAFR